MGATPRVYRKQDGAQQAKEMEYLFELRLQGYSYREMAKMAEGHFGLKMSHETARQRVERAIDERVRPKAEQYVEEELARLDRYLTKLEAGVALGDEKAVNAALRVSERRAKLLGLDQPVKADVQVTQVTQEDLELQELVREAQVARALAAEDATT